jgi:hypothetical protein
VPRGYQHPRAIKNILGVFTSENHTGPENSGLLGRVTSNLAPALLRKQSTFARGGERKFAMKDKVKGTVKHLWEFSATIVLS